MKLLLGIDLGSSAVKVSLLDTETGQSIAEGSSPKTELAINSPHPGWAEQDPETWWSHVVAASKEALLSVDSPHEVIAIGIAYQMHGLVLLDRSGEVLRPAIIWCDSRAVDIGSRAFSEIGEQKCLEELLNSPGNFTASKLRWVQENEPDIYDKIDCFMLPGDYIAFKLTGDKYTTASGLSEGVFWNFRDSKVSDLVTNYYEIDSGLIPSTVPTFGEQGFLSDTAASELGIAQGVPVTYRAGDQPNNALSLNVLNPGELAATAGTSGVVYAVDDKAFYDSKSRVNSFLHVNSQANQLRTGILFCLNGAGSSYAWLRSLIGKETNDYSTLNSLATSVAAGADGLRWYPFGNGAERMLENANPGASLEGLNFARHGRPHIVRAVKEGIVFALWEGLGILQSGGLKLSTIKAGSANLFLSPLFRQVLSSLSGLPIELYNTDGAEGAARGAGVGSGFYDSFEEAFKSLECLGVTEPDNQAAKPYTDLFQQWRSFL